ncbi:MAG: hypothetical protein LC635_03305 [Pseudonocardiaceae bacterium]|nr:hypothetical protein [Pseudonocardiaceae bacterium]
MTGIKFDATWVGGYATLTGNSAEALAEGVSTMGTAPLDQESFGSLCRSVQAIQAYGKAAGLLRDQLARAVESLAAAAAGLENVTGVYQDTDDLGRHAIRRGLDEH